MRNVLRNVYNKTVPAVPAHKSSRVRRALIWVVLFAVTVPGLALYDLGAPLEAEPQYVPLAADEIGNPADFDTLSGTRPQYMNRLVNAYCPDRATRTMEVINPFTNSGSSMADHSGCRQDPMKLLPAFRWSGSMDLYYYADNSGIGSFVPNGLAQVHVGIADMMFAFANFLWGLLLQLTYFAFNLNLIRTAGHAINDVFYHLSNAIGGSGITTIVTTLAFLSFAIAAAKGKMTGQVSKLIGVLIPVATLWALTAAVTPPPQSSQGANGAIELSEDLSGFAPGSPVWIADETLSVLSDVEAGLGASLQAIPGVNSSTERAQYALANPSCGPYVSTLYSAFGTAYQNQAATLSSASPGGAAGQLTWVSRIWEQTLLTNWIGAQYGSNQAGPRIYCRQLEGQAGISRPEQATVGAIAGYPDYYERKDGWDFGAVSTESLILAPNGRVPDNVLATGDNRSDPYTWEKYGGKSRHGSLFAWAACVWEDGEFRMQAGWAIASEGDGDSCKAWWTGKLPGDEGGKELMQWQDDVIEIRDTHPSAMPANLDASDTPTGSGLEEHEWYKDNWVNIKKYEEGIDDTPQDIRSVVSHFRSGSAPNKFALGALSVLTAAIYIWALGLLSGAVLFAQVGLILMLMLLPATLILMVLPQGHSSGGKKPLGKQMLAMTGGFLIAKLFLGAAATLFIVLVQIVTAIMPLGHHPLIAALVPLIVIAGINKTLKKAGIGSLFNPKTALGMAASGAYAQRYRAGKRAGGYKEAQDKIKQGPRAALGFGKKDRKNQEPKKGLLARGVGLGKRLAGKRKKNDDDKTAGSTAGEDSAKTKAAKVAKAAGGAVWAAVSKKAAAKQSAKDGRPTPKDSTPLDQVPPEKRPGAAVRQVGQGVADAEALLGADTDKDAPWAEASVAAALGAKNLTPHEAEVERLKANNIESLAQLATASADQRERIEQRDEEQFIGLAAEAQALVGSNGRVMTTPAGEPIFGFTAFDAAGARGRLVSPEEAGWDPSTGAVADGFQVHTAPIQDVSRGELEAAAQAYATHLGVNREAVAASHLGLPPAVMPTQPGPIDDVSVEAAAHMMSTNPLFFTTQPVLDFIHHAAEGDEAVLNEVIHRYNDNLGRPDRLQVIGIDVSDASGMSQLAEELERHLSSGTSSLTSPEVLIPESVSMQAAQAAVAAAKIHVSKNPATSQTVTDIINEAVDARDQSRQDATDKLSALAAQLERDLQMDDEYRINFMEDFDEKRLDQLVDVFIAAKAETVATGAEANALRLNTKGIPAADVTRQLEDMAAKADEEAAELVAALRRAHNDATDTDDPEAIDYFRDIVARTADQLLKDANYAKEHARPTSPVARPTPGRAVSGAAAKFASQLGI